MATPQPAHLEDVEDDATDVALEVLIKDIVLIGSPEETDDDATDIIVAGGPLEVVAAEDVNAAWTPPASAPSVPDDIDDLFAREEVANLHSLVLRLQGELQAAVHSLAEAEVKAGHEVRRGDTWQELALRSEERTRELTLELERYRGFACSPWWVRAKGLRPRM
jgi:hypothetical protein